MNIVDTASILAFGVALPVIGNAVRKLIAAYFRRFALYWFRQQHRW
jgi:hypothetical protein